MKTKHAEVMAVSHWERNFLPFLAKVAMNISFLSSLFPTSLQSLEKRYKALEEKNKAKFSNYIASLRCVQNIDCNPPVSTNDKRQRSILNTTPFSPKRRSRHYDGKVAICYKVLESQRKELESNVTSLSKELDNAKEQNRVLRRVSPAVLFFLPFASMQTPRGLCQRFWPQCPSSHIA